MATPIQAGVIVISTTAAQDPSADASSDVLSQVFADEGTGKWAVANTIIVPDDAVRITGAVKQLTDGDQPVSLVVTTGGTGFAVDDKSPEVSVFYVFVCERLLKK